jgi:hypothetical protein
VKHPASRITRFLARNRAASAAAPAGDGRTSTPLVFFRGDDSARDAADLLLGLINAAIAGRQAHLIGEASELPEDPGAFGWDISPGETPRPGGLCIGIAASGSGSGRRVYLFPVAAYAAAERAAASRGIPMPVTNPQASAVLAARHLIILDPADGGPAWRRIRNVTGRIWDMPADTLLAAAAPAAGPAPSTPPPGGKGH